MTGSLAAPVTVGASTPRKHPFGAYWRRRYLATFIRELCGILAEPGQLTVTYRHDDSAGGNAYQQEQAVKTLLLQSGPNGSRHLSSVPAAATSGRLP